MLVPIEIKVNVEEDVDAAMAVLAPSSRAEKRLIWFARPRAAAPTETPGVAAAPVVRFRSGDGGDDSTVKLRPCDPETLTGRWTEAFGTDGFEYRIEGDWAGTKHVLAASAVTVFAPGSLAAAVGAGNTAAALSDLQRDFVRSCAPAATVDGLVVLGPIDTVKWSDVDLGGREVNVERWSAAGLTFLELSLRVKPRHGDSETDVDGRAAQRQNAFEDAVRAVGLHVSTSLENKTDRMLAALAAAHHV